MTPMRTASFLAVLLAAAGLAAQSSRPVATKSPPVLRMESPAGTRAQGRYVLEAGEHRLRDLVQRSAQLLERTELVQWSESPEGGDATVTAQVRLDLDRAGFEELLTQLLWSRDWVLTTVDAGKQVFEWIYGKGPRANIIVGRAQKLTPAEVQGRPGMATAVLTEVKVKHVDPMRIANMLRPRLGRNRLGCDPVTPVPQGQSLVLHGMREDVIAALQMVETADQPAPVVRDDAPAPDQMAPAVAAPEGRMAALEARLLRLEKLVAELQRK
jgi:type II secretory pathway component GspD/PulD (secretin)